MSEAAASRGLPATIADPRCDGRGLRTVELAPGLRAMSCRGGNVHEAPLFVAVTSPVGNAVLREELRSKRHLFKKFPSEKEATYMFFVGVPFDPDNQIHLLKEMETFGDIVQLDIPDKFTNLAIKSVGAAAWAEKVLGGQGKVRYWLKVEDYMAAKWKDIMSVVKHLRDGEQGGGQPYYGGGMIFGGSPVMPDGRWGCPKRHCPYKTYPSTYAGGMYLLNMAAVRILAAKGLPVLTRDLADPYPVEDHFVAHVLDLEGVKVSSDSRLLWEGGKPYNAPSVVQDGYLLCLDTERRAPRRKGA